MFSHITLGTNDWEKARPFWIAVMKVLGHPVLFERDGELKIASLGYGVEARDEWLRLAGATCHGHGPDKTFVYEREPGLLRLFFPPPSWLERLLTLGAPASVGGLCSFSLEDALWPEVERALIDVCFAAQRTT